MPDIQHVWIVVLENKDYEDSFGKDTEAPYLAHELTKAGQLLRNYYGTSHLSLGNYITMVSGQAPNADTQADCQNYSEVFPGAIGTDGQAIGQGCVYPSEVKTVVNQLEEAGFTWRGYMEDMGNTPGVSPTCRHPEIGKSDDTQSARPTDQYAARHNPFVYFHSIIDSPTCGRNDVPLTQLLSDVKSPATTPNYAFITPDLCNDGHDAECADGGKGGLPAADAFLRRWVPVITSSPGFAQHGMLIITWDEANVSEGESSASCCDQQSGFNTPMPGIVGPGGGRTGTVVISPFVRPGSVNDTPYNHYGLLRTVEDLFGLPYLGYAGRAGLKPFGSDVFGQSAPVAPPSSAIRSSGCRPVQSGRAVAALRLRARLLSFRARKTTTIRIVARRGKSRAVRKVKRIRACQTYQLRMPKGTKRVEIRGSGRTQRIRRGPADEHDAGLKKPS